MQNSIDSAKDTVKSAILVYRLSTRPPTAMGWVRLTFVISGTMTISSLSPYFAKSFRRWVPLDSDLMVARTE